MAEFGMGIALKMHTPQTKILKNVFLQSSSCRCHALFLVAMVFCAYLCVPVCDWLAQHSQDN